MIAVATRPGAARVTALVLCSALLRALLAPAGDALSSLIFVACLGSILALEGRSRASEEQRWGRVPSAVLGVVLGLLLFVPFTSFGGSHGTLDHFWAWGGGIAIIATLEEAVIRGPLQRYWTQEAGAATGILASALTFALIHLPAYGTSALPLDFAVGLALAGLRAITGRILPCAVAHVVADWGAWF